MFQAEATLNYNLKAGQPQAQAENGLTEARLKMRKHWLIRLNDILPF
jgi:hypothetical protein